MSDLENIILCGLKRMPAYEHNRFHVINIYSDALTRQDARYTSRQGMIPQGVIYDALKIAALKVTERYFRRYYG